jgi:hypothetical protein
MPVSIFSLRSLGFKPAPETTPPATGASRVRLQESIEIALAWAQDHAEDLRNPSPKAVEAFGSLGGRARSFLGEQIADLRGALGRGDSRACSLALRELSERAILAGSTEGLRVFLAANAQTQGLALVAIAREEPVLLRQLLAAGANPNEPGPHGQSLARIALLRLEAECLRALLKAGAKTVADDRGTPGHWLAAVWHRPEMAATLVGAPESAEKRDSRHLRASECLRALKEANLPLDGLDREGRAPVAVALSGLIDTRDLLSWLEAGVSLAGPAAQKSSPLECFARADWRPIEDAIALADALMVAKADFWTPGPSGKTPFELAVPELQAHLQSRRV